MAKQSSESSESIGSSESKHDAADCADLVGMIAYEVMLSQHVGDEKRLEQQFRDQLVKLIDARIEAAMAKVKQ